MEEKVKEYEAGTWSLRYWFYIKILFARFKQFKSLKAMMLYGLIDGFYRIILLKMLFGKKTSKEWSKN